MSKNYVIINLEDIIWRCKIPKYFNIKGSKWVFVAINESTKVYGRCV